MSAAAGGVTTCVDMPYDVPRPVTDADHLPLRRSPVVEATSHVDMALYGTITKAGGVGRHRRPGRGRRLLLQALHL